MTTPTYDGNGNLTYDGTFTYCYDTESRLIGVIQGGTCASPTTTIATYAYDAQGRRKSKAVGGTTTIFVTDADNREVVEYDGSTGAVQNWYAYGLGPNEVLNQINGAGTTRATLIPDIQGSIIGLLAAASGALTKRGYRPYGESASVTGAFAYTGQRIDAETNGLYYYRARMYAPAWGRFMQADPIGYAGGSNPYGYADNDPLNLTDPTGNCPWCVGAAGGVTVYVVAQIVTNQEITASGLVIAGVAGSVGGGLAVNIGRIGSAVAASYGASYGVAAAVGGNSVLGAAISAGAATANNYFEGKPLTNDLAQAAMIGAAAGGVGQLVASSLSPVWTSLGRARILSVPASQARQAANVAAGGAADLIGGTVENVIKK